MLIRIVHGSKLRILSNIFLGLAMVDAGVPAERSFAGWQGIAKAAESCHLEDVSTQAILINQPQILQSQRAAPGGPWHISTLLFQLLPTGADRQAYTALVSGWLGQIATDQRVPAADGSELVVPGRPEVAEKILSPWLAKSVELRRERGETEDGTLLPEIAPFALSAIVNRMDLRVPGQCRSTAGQGRFVFRALEGPSSQPQLEPAENHIIFNAIFEINLPTDSADARTWANRWLTLGSCNDGDCAEYAANVQALTDIFGSRIAFAGSSLRRPLLTVRTNEVLTFPGQLREFTYVAETQSLKLVPSQKSVPLALNGTDELAAYVFANKAAILSESHSSPFLEYAPPMPRATRFNFANLENLPVDEFEALRFALGKNTCNGCHSFEHPRIRTIAGAYHIGPDGRISGFLTNEELPRRARLLCEAAAVPTCEDDKIIRSEKEIYGKHQ
jgi:hypothetical protein